MRNQQLANAFAIIKQINNNEWEFSGHYMYNSDKFICFRATRNGISLWLANGGWWCEIEDEPWQLGILGGWLVWLFAARKHAIALEKKMRKRPNNLTH